MQKAGKKEGFCFRPCASPAASGFALHIQCTSAKGPPSGFLSLYGACEKHHSPSPSELPLFLSPLWLGNTLPAAGVPSPLSHPHHQVSTTQPILEGLSSRKGVDPGPGDMRLRLSLEQPWKKHLTSWSLHTSSIKV